MEIEIEGVPPAPASQAEPSDRQPQPHKATATSPAGHAPGHCRPADILVLLYPSRYGSLNRSSKV